MKVAGPEKNTKMNKIKQNSQKSNKNQTKITIDIAIEQSLSLDDSL